ncbi:MAG: LamG-like jellyroll fold domain-containing protein [Pseudomonadota bacterium]
MTRYLPLPVLLLFALSAARADSPSSAETVALWLFDEPVGLYPSSTLDDSSGNDIPLTIGTAAQIAEGRFGHALLFEEREPLRLIEGEENHALFGFRKLPAPAGRSVQPMTWFNANFAALMTSGENHLRKEVEFVNPVGTGLNLGDFDWTVEFWHSASAADGKRADDAVVFELGSGPRGENDVISRLSWNMRESAFELINQPSGVKLRIPSASVTKGWRHYAFVYDAEAGQLAHYVDGKRQALPAKAALESLPAGDEAYFSVGRNGTWGSPMSGRLDELRVSRGQAYTRPFTPPGSFATVPAPVELTRGPQPLFAEPGLPLPLGSRKHVFLDDAILVDSGDAVFAVNPPVRAERVIDNIEGAFRKHQTVVEGDDGLIRLYNSVEDDHLAVYVSRDGVNFERPDLGRGEINGHRNIAIADNVGGLGNPFWDPQAPAAERWKYFTDYKRRGIYLYTSADGYEWRRYPTVILPFRSGTQSSTFYDDQRQLYVSYHRSGIFHTPGGATQRSSVVTEHRDLRQPSSFEPLTQQQYLDLRQEYPLRDPLPWYLDNGPLTPGGFGMEYPHKFDPTPADPVGVDFYLTKAMKYPWAADAYVAFPIAYFHYDDDGPPTRTIWGSEERGRGSGPLESQLYTSRNGLDWTPYPRPAYVGIGRHAGRDVVTAYLGHGMVKRGEEIWQYYFGETQYHSAFTRDPDGRGVYRLVQRLDGFVSLDSPYDREIHVVTKPLVFSGDRLQLNIDTDAVGYAQVGFLDEDGQPIEGFSVDDGLYINGDFIDTEVEWLGGSDVSSLAGKTVQLVFRMRGSKLYAMQFVASELKAEF